MGLIAILNGAPPERRGMRHGRGRTPLSASRRASPERRSLDVTAPTSEVVVAQAAEALLAFVDGWPEEIGPPSEQGNLVTWVRRRIRREHVRARYGGAHV